jgi:hypothetical protein
VVENAIVVIKYDRRDELIALKDGGNVKISREKIDGVTRLFDLPIAMCIATCNALTLKRGGGMIAGDSATGKNMRSTLSIC